MQNEKRDLSERLLNFGGNIIKLAIKLEKTAVEKHIDNQLMRSGTSAGANYEEACGAESKADFIHKMQLVLKELRESLYWLRLMRISDLVSHEPSEILLNESEELVKIIAKSIVTAKSKIR